MRRGSFIMSTTLPRASPTPSASRLHSIPYRTSEDGSFGLNNVVLVEVRTELHGQGHTRLPLDALSSSTCRLGSATLLTQAGTCGSVRGQLFLPKVSSGRVFLSSSQGAATMAPARVAPGLSGPFQPTLLIAAACFCLLFPACHAARSMLQNSTADPATGPLPAGTNASDVSGLLIGGTRVPDQLKMGVVVILTPAGLGTGVLIKPAWVLTAGHVVGEEVGTGFYGADPSIPPSSVKVCQGTSGRNWDANAQNCVTAKTLNFYDWGPGDAALIGLDSNAMILPGSWGVSQTYPTPNQYTNGYLFSMATSYPAGGQQVTLYGAGPESLDIGTGATSGTGLVRSAIFNTVGSCGHYECQYTTTQPCDQKNSIGGDSGGPVFSGNTIVGIHRAGACANAPVGATISYYLPVAAITAWVQATANTNGCMDARTNMIGATLIGNRVLPGIQDTLQAYQCYLGEPGKVYIALNSSQLYFNKEAVLISDSCNTQKNVCNMGINQNVNIPQVCVPAEPSSPTGQPVDPSALGSSFAFDVYKDSALISQHTGADSSLDSVCVRNAVPSAKEFQTSNFMGGGILLNWIGVGCDGCPGNPGTPTGPPNPQPGGQPGATSAVPNPNDPLETLDGAGK